MGEGRAIRRLEGLQQIAEALATAVDAAAVADVFLAQALPLLEADGGGSIHRIEGDRLVLLRARDLDPSAEAVNRDVPLDAPTPIAEAARTGRDRLLETPEAIDAAYPELAEVRRRAGHFAWLAVPLLAGEGRSIGFLGVIFKRPRTFDEDDRQFLRTLGRHCALALERARLFADEVALRRQAEVAAEREAATTARLAHLQRITAALVGLRDPEEIARTVLVEGLSLVGATKGSLLLRRDQALELVHHHGFAPEVRARFAAASVDAPLPTSDSFRDGVSLWLGSPEAIEARYPHLAAERRRWGSGAWATVPLRVGERILGVLGIVFPEPQPFDSDQRTFLETLAAACAQALDRARLAAAERRLASEVGEAKALLDSFFDSSPVGFAFHGSDLRTERINPTLAAAVGLPQERAPGRRLVDLGFMPAAAEVEAKLAEVLRTGCPIEDVEVPIEVAGVGPRLLLGSFFRIEAGGRPLGVGAVVRDITAERRAAEFRRNLLGIVGHDLRNPLAAVTTSVGVMLRRENLGEREVATLGRILTAAGRMERIIRDLLDVARAESGQAVPVRPRDADLEEIARAAAEEAMAGSPDRLVVVEGKGDPRGVWDPDRLGQALGNLVANALQHGSPDRPVRVRWSGDDDEAKLEVANEGDEIPPELVPALFEPFRKGARTRGGGLGLGLYIARELLRAHGGELAVRSQAGRTTFTARLPRRAPAQA